MRQCINGGNHLLTSAKYGLIKMFLWCCKKILPTARKILSATREILSTIKTVTFTLVRVYYHLLVKCCPRNYVSCEFTPSAARSAPRRRRRGTVLARHSKHARQRHGASYCLVFVAEERPASETAKTSSFE